MTTLAIALGGALAGCGGAEGQAEPPAPAAADTSAMVAIADFAYDPETITADAGAPLEFTNSDRAPHTATVEGESFDTGTLERDEIGEIVIDEPGTYALICRFHPFMKASVEVR